MVEIINHNDKEISLPISNDNIRHIFNALHGEPVSRLKTFSESIYIDMDSLRRLFFDIYSVLETCKVTEIISSVSVVCGREIITKDIKSFSSEEWSSKPNVVDEVSISVNFLYSKDSIYNGNPLKHSLYIRIRSSDYFEDVVNAGKILPIIDLMDLDEVNLLSPMICKTSHIDDQLANMLINTVTEWHKTICSPVILDRIPSFFKNNRNFTASIAHGSFSFFFLVSLTLLIYHAYVTNLPINGLIFYGFLSVLLYYIFRPILNGIGFFFGKKVYKYLRALSQSSVIFSITGGDKKQEKQVITSNKKNFTSFVFSFFVSIFVSVFSSIVVQVLGRYVLPS